MNGWMVKCGCQCLAYTDAQKLRIDFGAWLDDPEKAESEIQAREDRFHQFKKKGLAGDDRVIRNPDCGTPQACCDQERAPTPCEPITNQLYNTLRR